MANGLAATAQVITAAAAIMVFVFGSFLLETDRIVKLFGVGLAVAVLLDATVVRMLLVPATMELLGDRNWWLPPWLDRLLPTIDVEGHGDSLGEELDDGIDFDDPIWHLPRHPAFRIAEPMREVTADGLSLPVGHRRRPRRRDDKPPTGRAGAQGLRGRGGPCPGWAARSRRRPRRSSR